jgi:hypothetical protein
VRRPRQLMLPELRRRNRDQRTIRTYLHHTSQQCRVPIGAMPNGGTAKRSVQRACVGQRLPNSAKCALRCGSYGSCRK